MDPVTLSPAAVLADLDELEGFICVREWRQMTDEHRAVTLRLHAETVQHYRGLATEFMAMLHAAATIPQAVAALDASFLHGLTVIGAAPRPSPFDGLFDEALTGSPAWREDRCRFQHLARRRAPRTPRYRDRA